MISLIRKSRKKSAAPPPLCAHRAQVERDQHKDAVANSDSSQPKPPQDRLPASTAPTVQDDAKGKCTTCREEKSAARRYRWKVIGGLIFPFALQALDVTMLVDHAPLYVDGSGERTPRY